MEPGRPRTSPPARSRQRDGLAGQADEPVAHDLDAVAGHGALVRPHDAARRAAGRTFGSSIPYRADAGRSPSPARRRGRLDPNGRVFAVAIRHGKTTTARSLDARTGTLVRAAAGSRDPLVRVQPRRHAARERQLRPHGADLGRRAPGKLLHVLPHSGYVLAERFSPDGRSLVTSSQDGAAYVWDVATGQRELLLVGATGSA